MGGILTNVRCETPLAGLYAAGECASVGIHGANRLGSNSLVEIVVFGKVAGAQAAEFAATKRVQGVRGDGVRRQAETTVARLLGLLEQEQGERVATLRGEMVDTMEAGIGIYRNEATMTEACNKLAELRDRYRRGVRLDDGSRAFNTEWLSAIELGFMLEVAEALAHCARARRESRGAHMRLDGFEARDDEQFLAHSLAYFNGDGAPRLDTMPVTITKSPPRARVYGGAGKQAVMT
jgi:fumarate reductase flavoprotein subunit